MLFAILLDIDVFNVDYTKIVAAVFGILFFSTIFITIGIFKEYKKVEKSVFNFGIIVETIYMVYLYILNTNIYRYGIYLLLVLLMTFINNSKKTNEKAKIIGFIIFIIIGILNLSTVIIK